MQILYSHIPKRFIVNIRKFTHVCIGISNWMLHSSNLSGIGFILCAPLHLSSLSPSLSKGKNFVNQWKKVLYGLFSEIGLVGKTCGMEINLDCHLKHVPPNILLGGGARGFQSNNSREYL